MDGRLQGESGDGHTDFCLHKPTAAEIVEEARKELQSRDREKIRAIRTNRPFTPLTDSRRLLGSSHESRPPSAFSLSSVQFDANEASRRPPSGRRLTPLSQTLSGSDFHPRPPSSNPSSASSARKGSASRSILASANVTPPGSATSTKTPLRRRGSLQNLKDLPDSPGSRRVHSGPSERSNPTDEPPECANNGNEVFSPATSSASSSYAALHKGGVGALHESLRQSSGSSSSRDGSGGRLGRSTAPDILRVFHGPVEEEEQEDVDMANISGGVVPVIRRRPGSRSGRRPVNNEVNSVDVHVPTVMSRDLHRAARNPARERYAAANAPGSSLISQDQHSDGLKRSECSNSDERMHQWLEDTVLSQGNGNLPNQKVGDASTSAYNDYHTRATSRALPHNASHGNQLTTHSTTGGSVTPLYDRVQMNDSSSVPSSTETSPSVKSPPAEVTSPPPSASVARSEKELFYDSTIEPLLCKLHERASSSSSAGARSDRSNGRTSQDQTSSICSELYERLKEGGLLKRECSKRQRLLKVLFKFLDRKDTGLLLVVAKLVLALDVRDKNFESICKLLFKLSRDSQNDPLFGNDPSLIAHILEALSENYLPETSGGFLYGYGALKLISSHQPNNELLLSQGAVRQLASDMNVIVSLMHLKGNLSPPADKEKSRLSQICVQITSALRNLANEPAFHQQFVSAENFSTLIDVLRCFTMKADIVQNVASMLGKLTENAEECSILCSVDGVCPVLMQALKDHYKNKDVALRLSFVLGNMAGRSEEARLSFYKFPQCIQVLAKTLSEFANSKGTVSSPSGESEDVLVKIIRLVANLTISPEVGQGIGVDLDILCSLHTVIENYSIDTSEELTMTTLVTINNLSYYHIQDPSPEVMSYELTLASTLLKFLLNDKLEGLIEACRVYGNLTQRKNARDALADRKVLDILITLLDSDNRELVFSCCGVLINFMIDEDKRPILLKEDGIAKLVDVLDQYGQADWQLASLVCQTLMNYSARIYSSSATFGALGAEKLSQLLTDLLDESIVDRAAGDSWSSYTLVMWESEFVPVATKLLRRIKTHESHMEPL